TGVEQMLAQSRQQSESTIFEEQFILHPHCESRMSLLCTFKIITKSPCFNGSGAARRPYHSANTYRAGALRSDWRRVGRARGIFMLCSAAWEHTSSATFLESSPCS